MFYFFNGGVLHFYSFVVLSISFYIYYMYFYEHLIPVFLGIKRIFRPLKREIGFAKSKMYGIMIRLRAKRRYEFKDEQTKKNKENESYNISS